MRNVKSTRDLKNSQHSYDHSMTVSAKMKVIQDYASLITAMQDKRKAKQLTLNQFDDLAGLQDGYMAKIEAWPSPKSGRGLGPLTLPLILEGLGVVLIMADRPSNRASAALKLAQQAIDNGQLELDLKGGKNRQWPKGVNPNQRTITTAAKEKT